MCVDVVPVEKHHATGGQVAISTMPDFGVEALRLAYHGPGGLLLLLVD